MKGSEHKSISSSAKEACYLEKASAVKVSALSDRNQLEQMRLTGRQVTKQRQGGERDTEKGSRIDGTLKCSF